MASSTKDVVTPLNGQLTEHLFVRNFEIVSKKKKHEWSKNCTAVFEKSHPPEIRLNNKVLHEANFCHNHTRCS